MKNIVKTAVNGDTNNVNLNSLMSISNTRIELGFPQKC